MGQFYLLVDIGAIVGAASWHGFLHYRTPSEPGKPSPALDAPHATTPKFPIERTITNRDGTSIAARLVGRDATHLRLVRLEDGASFSYPIASLSAADQEFVRALSPNAPSAADSKPAASTSAKSPEQARLQRQRTELQHQIDLLMLELQKRDSANPQLPRDEARRRITELQNEIISIDQKLLDLDFRARD